MRIPSAIVAASLCALVVGCSLAESPGPSVTGPDGSATESVEPDPTAAAQSQLMGAWRPAPIDLGDPQIAVISDACAAAARTELGEAEANLPTALVDARGEGLVTAILSDDHLAIECLARLDDGGAATVDGVARLAASTTAPLPDAKMGLTSLVEETDREGGRIVAFGRVGPKAFMVKLGFDDESEVFASNAAGWWAAWWPGHPRASAIAAVDSRSLVIGNVQAPAAGAQVEGRVGPAAWWLDPKAPAPTAGSVSIRALVLEQACASGKTPEGRVEAPTIDLTETAVTVSVWIRHLPGAQDCQGNAPFPVTIKLPEALAERTLLDGSEQPPRDASKPPAG